MSASTATPDLNLFMGGVTSIRDFFVSVLLMAYGVLGLHPSPGVLSLMLLVVSGIIILKIVGLFPSVLRIGLVATIVLVVASIIIPARAGMLPFLG